MRIQKLILLGIITILVFIFFTYREYFDYSEKQKIFIHSRLLNLAQKITAIFEENNIIYFIHSGTLLGSVREGNIISHDDDIDIGVFPHDVEFLVSDEFNQILKKKDLKFIPFENDKGIIKLHEMNSKHNIFIDIFVFRKNGNKIEYNSENSRNIWKNGFFKENELFPLTIYPLGNIQLLGPNNPYPYLRRHFGNDWKVPKNEKKNHSEQININENCYGQC